MNSRSKKYHDNRKAGKVNQKDSPVKSATGTPDKMAVKPPKNGIPTREKPAATATSQQSSATQDDTGGGNDSGKRSDDN